jgi:periplasmic protein CpxP/Spy
MLLAAGLMLLPASASQLVAQEAPPSPPAASHHAHVRTTLDDRVKVFAKQLDLNDQQQAAVKRILEQRQRDTFRIRQDASLSGEERIGRFRALQDQTAERIRAVLTEEQKKKYDPLAVRRIQPSPDQRSVEDWLKATTPK